VLNKLWLVLTSLIFILGLSFAYAAETLQVNEQLSQGQYLESSNGAFRFNLQGDGNLVLREQSSGSALWSSKTGGQNGTKLSMQGDGNLVLYTSANSAVWASGTNGTGVTNFIMQGDGNAVLLTSSGTPVWDTATANGSGGGNADGGDTGTGGGSAGGTGGETANSTGDFSAPSAALYSLNRSKALGFPKHIDTGFGGNGHAESWDGRFFVRTRTGGWFASAFRPERIVRNNDGSVDFKQGAFGNSITLELNADEPSMQHNWLAIVPDFSVSGENPYPSNANGNYQQTGSHKTYKALVYHTTTDKQMGIRKATFIVSDANTRNAQLIKADFTNSFNRLRLQSGGDFKCIEPTVTIDGRLVVCQGHPNNDGKIDNLVYSYTTTPGSTTNWTAPKSMANMYFDDRNTNIEGLPFAERYPIAQQPILDATGNDFNRGELIKGAYPWISRDGTELFYQASNQGVSARRTGTSVFGRWTGWTIRHIDGPISRDRHRTSKLFLSSPGAFTTMWTPYKDIADLAIPYSLQGPVYPIFGSNTSDYSEIGFDDYLDGNYIMYLGMNEQLNRAGNYQVTRTNDTSGNFNNASLVGARFPIEFNGQDILVGRYGQAIHFNSNNYLNVTKNKGWNSLAEGVSVDMWVRKSSGNGKVRLFNMQDGVELNLINGSTLSASIHDTNSNLVQINGSSIGNNTWAHVAFTFNAQSKEMALYINGESVATKNAGNFGTLRTSGAVRVGLENSSGQVILDEVKVSNVARRAYEIAHNANVRTNTAPSSILANQVPDHLKSLLDNSTGVDRFSTQAAELGEDLFADTILSKQQTTSCTTCHDDALAFADGLDIARGNEPTDAGNRNTPMLQNRLFSSLQGWSGLAGTLDTQALIPIAAAHEMNLPLAEAVQRLRADGTYANRFQQVYGEQVNETNLALALASFEAIQFSPKNRVDEFKEGNTSILSVAERRGLDLFEGKARCSGCHSGANLTDESFRNNGLAMNDDIGRAEVTGRDRDHKLFKVPSLRELGLTGPYMHDGSISTLKAVVEKYNEGARNVAATDSDIRALELSSQEVNDVVAYLAALSVNGDSGGTGGNNSVSEVSRVNGNLVGGAGSSKPGFTLYVFDNDQASSSSNCNGGCATAWPPVMVEDSAASGLSGLSIITRSDGSKQAAYNGRPLYFYAQDNNAGDTSGNGVNNTWWLAGSDTDSGGGTGNEEPRQLYTYSFGGLESLTVAGSVDMLERLGYAGITAESSGTTALNRLGQYHALSESKGDDFEVVSAFLSHKFNNSGFSDAEHRAAIDRLSGKEGSLWVWFHDPDNQASASELEGFIQGILDYAVSKNVKLVLYPHFNTDLPTATDAMNMANNINHPSLGVAVNLSHELMSGKGGVLAQTFNQVKNRLVAVTISGAKNTIDNSSTGARERSTIMPLDESEYDLRPYMRLIKTSGYEGPVGFLNFKLSNPADYLERTINRWNSLALEVGLYKQVNSGGGDTTTYNLTVNSGSGDNQYAAGVIVSINADTPPTGQVFDKWIANSGNPIITNVTASTTTLIMPGQVATVTASYKTEGSSLRNPENPSDTVNGLDYQYYNGTWSALPNFSALVSAKAGSVTNFSLNERQNNDNFGFTFKGYINIPTDGTYTFYTRSDDGSQLSIGNTLVVNNDGLHGSKEVSGQIGLKAGKHAINVGFFERTGGEVLQVNYQGPGISKKLISNNVLYRAVSVQPVTNIALGKTTTQSSTAAGGLSARAVDGNTNGVYTNGSITHTSHDTNAWWKVNLGVAHQVNKVTIWNRTDCCSNRLTNFHVDALDANGNVIATQNFPGEPGVKTDLNLSANGVYGVRVQLNGGNPLSLAEVQVFGSETDTPQPITYALAINSGSGDNRYLAGAKVTITANNAPSGQTFDRWVANSGSPGIANTSAATTTLTMPARSATVTATYKDIPVTTFTLTVNSGSGDNKYAAGTTVTIKADNAPSGQTFDRWIANSGNPGIANVTSATTTVTMPARIATVTASYKTLSAGGPVGYTKCTNEGGSCTFSQRVDVAYGANGKFAYKAGVIGTITFNNATFGDPISGIQKAGYSKAAAADSDTTRPVITLLGSARMTVTQDASFNDPGATANDNKDGNLTSAISKSGNVNTAKVGNYTLSYSVSDAAGNNATIVNRFVTVKADSSVTENIVLPANGSVLQSFTSEYSSNYAAAALTDGITTDAGWASTANPGVQSFVYGFRDGKNATLNEAVIYAGTGEGSYFSEGVEVWSSIDGNNYTMIKDGTLPQGLDSITLDLGGIVAKNVKLVITSGYRSDYWELGEFVVNGSINSDGDTGGGADITRPIITLVGSAQMNIMQGTTFNDPGATAADDIDGNLTGSITKSGSVNTASVGSYALSYNVNDAAGNPARTVTRSVNVTLSADNTRPVITLNGNQTLSVVQGTSFNDPGATASDNRDGNITNTISKSGSVNTANVGNYTLSYNVSDAAGNKATTVIRKVNVILGSDNTAPEITLLGNKTMSIVQGTSFSDPGADASDNRDGNITNEITKSGSVNTNQVGTYTLSYNVSDAAGNNAPTVQRTVNVTSSGSSDVSHIGSTADYDGADKINISVPSNAATGDLLLLFLSRTDDLLPVNLDGWTAGASCFKTNNGQSDCHEIRHCSNRDGDYCLDFNGGNGQDLATVVFYKTLSANENRNYSFNLRGNHPTWAILSAVRGANNNDPIRNVATESNDNNADSLFPSVSGNTGDLLLLSMAFDDTTKQADFGAPSGMEMHKWIAGNDEAGYVYGQKLTSTGQTGSKKTSGPGGPRAKDALISMTIRASGNAGGGDTGGGSGGGDSATGNNTIELNQALNVNDYLVSENGRYRLYLQGDGNIVLRDQQSGSALWSSGTNGKGGTRLVLQGGDGNFVLYTASGIAVWASGTNGTGASRVVINNDGSLAIYSGDNPVWAENGSGDTGGGDAGGNTGGGDSGGVTQTGTFEKRISSSLDDVEEQSSGSINATSTDIELVFDNSNQNVGLRFTGVSVPEGAIVTRAYVQFTADERNTGTTSLSIKAHDTDDAPAFTTSSRNVSNRATTNASTSWQPDAWNTVGAATANERTPDIKDVIQEVVSRSGWNSGNDIVIIITGTGERTAESFNGSSTQAPLLRIEYTYTEDTSGGGDTGENTGSGEGTKIAFIGDTGAGGNFQSVLNLIKAEGAELTIVAGDTSYSSSKDDDWDAMVRNTLGNSDPTLVVAGNHDYGDSNFSNVRSFGQSRLNRQSAVQCSGDYAEKMNCNYKNVYFVMSAIGASGSRSSHESFISNSLNNIPDGAWRICAWHKNQRDMQVGGKTDETGWTAYETCRQQGAIITTGHEHSYSRTHLLSDMSSQTIASKSSTMTVEEGKTIAFVSGLGGVGIRDQERGGDHWAKIYTSSQGARYGAMFGTFYEDRAEFYFKNINGQIIDQFTVIKGY
jgi:cytochrome c peroxidase